MGVRVLKSGLLTTIQDLGRTGFQNKGIRTAGVMDVRSFRIANLLLDNPENEAVMECTLIGPELEFTSSMIISITGGDFQPRLNGDPVPMYTALFIKNGDILSLGAARTGRCAYIAFSNYLQIPVVMGSRSTDLTARLGGLRGRALQEGDYISTRIKRRKYLPYFLSRHLPVPSFSTGTIPVRVIMGPQDEMFTHRGIHTFLQNDYTVTGSFDRMGMRLDGMFVETRNGSDILSDGIAAGSVQVPPDGKPIILLSDHQTTGGYAKIATVISVDRSRLAQCRSGDKLRFEKTDVRTAQKLILAEEREFQMMRDTIHQPCREVLECRLTAGRLQRLFDENEGRP